MFTIGQVIYSSIFSQIRDKKIFRSKKSLPLTFFGVTQKKIYLPKVVCYEKLIQWSDLSFFTSCLFLAENLVTKPSWAKFHRLRFGSNLISRWTITWEYLPTNLSSFGAANFFIFFLVDGISQTEIFVDLWFGSNLIWRSAIIWECLPTNLSSFGAPN